MYKNKKIASIYFKGSGADSDSYDYTEIEAYTDGQTVEFLKNEAYHSFKGNRGYGISGYDERRLKVPGFKPVEELTLKGKHINYLPDWAIKKFREIGVPDFDFFPCYGGSNSYRVLPPLRSEEIEQLKEKGLSEKEAQSFLKIKAGWKWETVNELAEILKLVKEVPQLRNVFKELSGFAKHHSNRSMQKIIKKWGLNSFQCFNIVSVPRCEEYSKLIYFLTKNI